MTVNPFRRVSKFSAQYNPREIEQLEQSINTTFDAIRGLLYGPSYPFVHSPDIVTSIRLAKYREILLFDPTVAGFCLLIPRPDRPNAGPIIFKNISSSVNPIAVRTVGSDYSIGETDITNPDQTTEAVQLGGEYKSWMFYPDPIRKIWTVLL